MAEDACGHPDLEILVDHKGDPVRIICHACSASWAVQENDFDWDRAIAEMKC